jgi:hypothetical protein
VGDRKIIGFRERRQQLCENIHSGPTQPLIVKVCLVNEPGTHSTPGGGYALLQRVIKGTCLDWHLVQSTQCHCQDADDLGWRQIVGTGQILSGDGTHE